MGYELQFYDDLIREHFVLGYQSTLSDSKFKELKERIAAQGHAAKGRILQHTLGCSSAAQMELYIQNTQTGITLAMDALDNSMQLDVREIYTIHNDTSLPNLAKLIFMALDELMFLLKTYFLKHFDKQAPVPRILGRIAECELLENARWIRKKLRGQEAPPELVRMLARLVRAFCRGEHNRQTDWQQMLYLQALTTGVARVVGRPGFRKNEDFVILLESKDFNSPEFREWLIGRYKKQLSAVTDTEGKREALRKYIREAEHRFPKTGDRLLPEAPSLYETVVGWLEEQLRTLKAEGLPKPPVAITESVVKMPTTLTVPQMAHMLRLIMETGIYVQVSPINAIRFQAGNFQTPREQQLSAESMRQKYYTPDSTTAASVRDLLLKMIHHSKRMVP